MAVVHDGELGEEKRGREWPHGHGFVVDLLGSGGDPRTTQGGSRPPAAIPPSWRCTGESGVGRKGQWTMGWRGVEESELGAASFYNRWPVHGGRGATVVQGTTGRVPRVGARPATMLG